MIVSHQHRFIFLAVPKTGTQSVRAALRPHLDPDTDWEQADWGDRRRLPVAGLAAIGHGHISAAEARQALDPETWRTYFKFAFVRNPWDRFISSAFFRNRERPLFMHNPRGFLKLLLKGRLTREDVLFRPQYEFLVGEDPGPEVDFVGRFERLADDFDYVCKHLGLAPSPLPHLNSSAHDEPRSYYDEELTQIVERHYEDDIRRFDYIGDRPNGGVTAPGDQSPQDRHRP